MKDYDNPYDYHSEKERQQFSWLGDERPDLIPMLREVRQQGFNDACAVWIGIGIVILILVVIFF
jgi:hypothetical protein